jgi:hypothetical protein
MESQFQTIYLYKVQLTWKVTTGKSYVNHYKGTEERPYEFVSRAESIEDINRNPEIIYQMMVQNGLTGKKIKDFYVKQCFEMKPISQSFAHKKEDYEQEFKN